MKQINRTRKAAEVFTPSWICNEMNNHCDEQWFGRPNVFNTPNGHDWTPYPWPIWFEEDKQSKRAGWKKYVDSKRLEITAVKHLIWSAVTTQQRENFCR